MTRLFFCRSRVPEWADDLTTPIHNKLVTECPFGSPTRAEEGPDCSLLVGELQPYAAARRPWVKTGPQTRSAKTLQNAFQEMQAHAADQLGVLLCQGVEWAVVQDDVAAGEPRPKPVILEQADQQAGVALAGLVTVLFATHVARQGLAEVTRLPVKNLAGRLAGLLGLGHSAGQQPSGEVVLAGGQRDRDLASGALIELGRAARAGAVAPGATCERDREQAKVGQAVEMESRRAQLDTKRCRQILTTDRGFVINHIVVDAPPGRLIQTRHRRDIGTGLGSGFMSRPAGRLTGRLTSPLQASS